MGQAGARAAEEREEELAHVQRALDEALIEDNRVETLAQFDCTVRLIAKERRWHTGLRIARKVHSAVACWREFDPAPYALTVAQFAHNYAIELQEARLFDAAEELFSEALALFETHGDATRQMVTAHQLGRVRQARGQLVQAERAYVVSLALAREHSELRLIALNLFQLGQIAQLNDESERSEMLYHEVLALARSKDSVQLMNAAVHQLGILAQARGDCAEARCRYEKALEHARGAGDARAMADALHQLGMIAHEQGEYDRAVALYHASLEHAARVDDPAVAAPTLYQLAQLALSRGHQTDATNYGQQALALLQAQGDLSAIQRVKSWLLHLTTQRDAGAVSQSD